ncbi:MAG TPA: VOC family protein [Casimicrobiaceae bacterium]|jgi:PhnB protein|nr:VOC family protein [Casimicrobiaceae bacterium]
MVDPVPSTYRGVTAYLILRDAARAFDFYQKAFAAEPVLRLDGPDGKIAHAEVRIAGGVVMMSEENLQMGYKSPHTLGGSPVHLMFYVPDVDRAFERAIAAGGTVHRAVQDQFYGDRSGTLTDPFGILWTLATHIEDVTEEEVKRRMASMGAQS